MPKAKEAALKALALDDKLAEAHASLGQITAYYDYDFTTAEREYRRAMSSIRITRPHTSGSPNTLDE